MHVSCALLKLLQVRITVFNNKQLVVDVVAREQQSHGCGKGQPAVRAVGGQLFVPAVGTDSRRQIVAVRKGVQAEDVIPYSHFFGTEGNIFERSVVFSLQGKVAFQQPARFADFVGSQAFQRDKSAVVQYPFELIDAFRESNDAFFVLDFLWQNRSAAQRAEIALLCHPLSGGFGDKKEALVIEIRTFVEMPFKTPAEETQSLFLYFGLIVFFDKPILLMHDGKIRQNFHGFVPGGVDCRVFGRGYGKEFGQFYPERRRYIGIFRYDAVILNGQQRKLIF